MAREPKAEPGILENILQALPSLSFEELIQVGEKTRELEETKKAEAKEAFLAEVRLKAQHLGLSVVDSSQILPRYIPIKRTPSPSTGPKTYLYHDGKGNQWTGRGPRPAWLKAELEAGKSLDDLRIHPASTQS